MQVPRSFLARTLALFWLCASACASAGDAASAAAAWSSSLRNDEAAILTMANDYRARHGLERWQTDSGLQALAQAASDSMARAGRASHEGFRTRFDRSGARLCVENIVSGPVTPALAVGLWRRSATHDRNLLEPRALWVGVSTVNGYTTLFACDQPAAPVRLAVSS